MDFWIQNYIASILFALIAGALILPNILHIAHKKHLYDTEEARKIHTGVVPRLGGVSFLPAIGISLCLIMGLELRIGGDEFDIAFENMLTPLLFAVAGVMLIYLVGMTDDLISVAYRTKFLFQIIGGCLFIGSGYEVYNLYGFCGLDELSMMASAFLTVFWAIYVLNAINLIDGIDGLACGLTVIALLWYSYVFYEAESYICLLICGATIGALVSFFYFNYFGRTSTHTKIFMGDTGALCLGYILVFLTISILNLPAGKEVVCGNPFIVGIAPLILPCFDVFRVFFHRLRKRRHPFHSDSTHIHHKLIYMGMSFHQVLWTLLAVDIVLMGVNLALCPFFNPTWIIAGDIVVWIVGNMLLTAAIHRREKRIGKILFD
ncbi:MAG: undecaprenyl/decaprenyl-phosphate alpha-N-acetylglucosaminyl 1-phosphate transferase [Muribaculaceae bacterium]|nr:undecaprenyl/decaprenyl-phosphate alpha-N-acetylglucosaminyl 1-phosphate transferase [Muribaculaceae bacterium]